MLIPLNWLKEFVKTKNPQIIAKQLTRAGLEVEQILDYQGKEQILQTEVTPNRGDWASVLGTARELVAILKQELKIPQAEPKKANFQTADKISVKVETTKACPKYLAWYLEGITVKDSDQAIKKRVDQTGQRPINNIVDGTNYTMMGLGQPLHAFDSDKISGNQIIVRLAKEGEKITLLDGKSISLTDKDLVIADSKKPIALAGIMGGLESEVTTQTKNVVIEAAWFNPKVIRATAQRYKLATEASYRFERGIDPEIIELAAVMAAEIIQKNCQAKVAKEPIVVEKKREPIKVEFRAEKINQKLGLELNEKEIEKYLSRLGFEIKESGESGEDKKENKKNAIVPSWRGDIKIEEDLAEEVGRLYGLDNLPKKRLAKKSFDNTQTSWWQKELLRDLLSNMGLVEVINYSFLSKKEAKVLELPIKDLPKVVNPQDKDINYLRSSLASGLLKTVVSNPQESKVEIFEIGNVFIKKEETVKLGIGLAGKARSGQEIVSEIKKQLKLKDLNWQITDYSQKQLKKLKIKRPKVELLEIDLTEIINKAKWPQSSFTTMPKKEFQYQPISKYPAVNRDLAFIVSKDLSSVKVEAEIKKISKLIIRVELFDEFVSDKFGKNKKNIAFHLFFQAPDRTLTDQEVDKLIKKSVERVEEKFKGELRG